MLSYATIELMRAKSIALVLDSAPQSWQSQDDLHYGICRELQRRGWGTVIVHSGPIGESVRKRYLAAGIHLECCNHGLGTVSYFRGLRRIVREYNVQLADICFFNHFQWPGWIARLAGIPQLVFTEVSSGFSRATGWKLSLLFLRAAVTTWPYSRLIAISGFVRDQLCRVGIARQRFTVVHGGVDTTRFHPDDAVRRRVREELGIEDGELLLVSLNYLKAFKRVDIQLNACAILKKRGLRFRLIIGGDGPMRTGLERQASQLGLTPGTVTFVGHQTQPQRLVQAADLFLHSAEGEAFGLVLAEALACGTPIAGSVSGSLPEIVINGENGWLAEPDNPDSFASAIERLISDREQLERMRLTARRYAEEKFPVSLEVARTVAVYESIGALQPQKPLVVAAR